MPPDCAQVFAALVRAAPDPLTVAQVQSVLGVRHPQTARTVMQDLDRRGVMAFVEDGPGKPAHLCFQKEWAWCASPAFQAILAEQPVKNRGV
jgi:hypothetical protein